MKTAQLGSALIPIPGTGGTITYDPTTSGLTSTDLQSAIDELQAEIGALPPTGVDVTDGTVTVTGALTVTAPAGGVTAISGTNAGLEFLTNVNGGQGKVKSHGNFGATETIDLVDGNWHWGTLNANCTFTFTVIAGTTDCEFWLELIEDGTGGWSPTFPGSVTFPGGTPVHDTTLGTTTIYGFITRDGGTSWIGGVIGTGGSALTIKDEGTPLATAATSLDFVGVGVVASGATGAKTITIAGLTVDDEGTPLTSAATTLDFVGAGVTASGASTTKTITIPGGATASDTGIWRPLLDSSTGAIIVNGTTGEATMGFGAA